MIRIAKLGELIYENFEPVVQEAVAFDEQGNPTQFQERSLLPTTKAELIQVVTDTLKYLQKQRLQKVLDQYGYNSLGDVQLYASQNDTEAQAILNWYTNANSNGYDDLIWNYIDSLPNKTKTEILNDLQDLMAVEEQLFQQAVQNNPLP